MVFCPISNMNQHLGIFGSTGVGKTRYVEPLIVQAIRSGAPTFIIDPKGDPDLTNRTYEEARKYGRAHQVRYFSLVLPKNPNCCTMNPLSDYNDVTFLGARVGSVIVQSKEPYWRDIAIKTSREILALCHYAREYLQFIDRNRDNGRLAKRTSIRVPKLLLALQYAAACGDADLSPETAEAEVDRIIRSQEDRSYTPDQADLTVLSLMRLQTYTPVEWNPTVRQVFGWGLDNTSQFLGWILKAINYHCYVDDPDLGQPNFPAMAPKPRIDSLAGRQPSLWSIYKSEIMHPLEALATPNPPPLGVHARRWMAYFEHFVGKMSEDDRSHVIELFKHLKTQLDSIHAMCSEEREKFLEKTSTLGSALSRFKGSRERIIAAQEPDVNWEEAVRSNHIIYIALGQLVDQDGAVGIAKMLVQDIGSYIGRVYSFTEDSKKKPFFLFCDEVASFANEPLIDLLNKGRGAGLHCTIIGQAMCDLEATLQDRAKAKQVIANLNTMVQLRSGDADDAKAFAQRGGQVSVVKVSRNTSVTPGVGKTGNQQIEGFSANESWNRSTVDVPKIPESALLNTPRGQAFIHMMGEIYYVAQAMFPAPITDMKEEFHMTVEEGGGAAASQQPSRVHYLFQDMKESIVPIDYLALYGLSRLPAQASAEPSDATATPSISPAPAIAPAADDDDVEPPPIPISRPRPTASRQPPAQVPVTTSSTDQASGPIGLQTQAPPGDILPAAGMGKNSPSLGGSGDIPL
jgi:hypothetical protein